MLSLGNFTALNVLAIMLISKETIIPCINLGKFFQSSDDGFTHVGQELQERAGCDPVQCAQRFKRISRCKEVKRHLQFRGLGNGLSKSCVFFLYLRCDPLQQEVELVRTHSKMTFIILRVFLRSFRRVEEAPNSSRLEIHGFTHHRERRAFGMCSSSSSSTS